jgi:hypothetical protein
VSVLVHHLREVGAEWPTQGGQKRARYLTRELARLDAYPPSEKEKARHHGKVERYRENRRAPIEGQQRPLEHHAPPRLLNLTFL